MKLSDQLKKYRVLNNLTQEDLANHIHITRQAVSRWENDLSEPDIPTLKKIAELYQIQLEELINGKIDDFESRHKKFQFYYFINIFSFFIPFGFIISIYTLLSIRNQNMEYKILKGICISRVLVPLSIMIFLSVNFI